MLKDLFSLPTLLSALIFAAVAVASGLLVWSLSHRFQGRASEESRQKLTEATGNLFRAVGWLFSLLLSLSLTDVIGEWATADANNTREGIAILDIHYDLRRLGLEKTRAVRELLIDYTQSIIEDEWPALAQDQLSPRTNALMRQLGDGGLQLEATTASEKDLRNRILSDLDLVRDNRWTRLEHARESPSIILVVVYIAYLVTMVYFGSYPPRPFLVGMVSLFMALVGAMMYLIFALNEPYRGATSLTPAPYVYVLETMKADEEAWSSQR